MLRSPAGVIASAKQGLYIPPDGATYREVRVDGASSLVYTFAAVDIGVANTNRRVVVATGSRTTTLSSVTIGGVAATIHQADTSPNVCQIVSAVVPTGTTADVVVTYTGTTPARAGIGVWTIDGAASTFIAGAIGANGIAFNLATEIDDIIIAYGFENGGTASTATWVGVTEDFDSLVESDISHSGAHGVAVTSPNTSLTLTWDSTTGTSLVAAAFRQ